MASSLQESDQLVEHLNRFKANVRDKVLLDVGGREFSTTVNTLTSEKNTFFTALFSSQWELEKDERGRIFIDRSGDLFAEILEYMRNPHEFVLIDERLRQRLTNEAKFYKLNNLVTILQIESERKADEERQNIKFEGTTLLNLEQQLKLNEFYDVKDQRWKLLYKASINGFSANEFHHLCDNQGPTMTVIKSTGGYLFGGYASQSWASSDYGYNESNSFLFLLTNANGNPPTKFPHNKKSDYALEHHSDYGPVFGDKNSWTLYISSESNANTKSGCQLTKNSAYLDILRLEEATFTGSKNFQTKEIEVFKLADI